MNSNDNLAMYLHDHLAGSYFAIRLLGSMHEQYKDEELGAFALALRQELRQDQVTLQTLADHVGKTSVDLTQATGWLAEKASQFKLQRDDTGGGIGTFEALETLSLGIRGKISLWQVLPIIREIDTRVPALDFDNLIARAEKQHKTVESQRLLMARITFRPVPRE